MVVTLTPSTVAATVVASIDTLQIVVVILLIVLLIAKELASALHIPHAQQFSRDLNVGAAPLLFVFAVIFISKVLVRVG